MTIELYHKSACFSLFF